MRHGGFRVSVESVSLLLCIMCVSLTGSSSDKGPSIIVLGAGSGGSAGFSSLTSGSSSSSSPVSSEGSGSMIPPGGSPNILVLGGADGKKGDKKASVIIIMQPQPAPPAPSTSAPQHHQQSPSSSDHQHQHPYFSHHVMAMPPIMHYPMHQDYYASSSMQPQMHSRRGMFGGVMSPSSYASMSEESVLKLMNHPAFHSGMKASASSPIGHKQWIGMASEPFSTTVADSIASPSDLSDYLSHSYGFRK